MNQRINSYDLSFIFNSSNGNSYRITDKEDYNKTLLVTADSLTYLFNKNVGIILSWPEQVKNNMYWSHNTIIDNVINLELMFAAYRNSDNPLYTSLAVSHADVTIKNYIRTDSTVYHVLVYDDKTGECIRKCTHQAYADNFLWASGKAWAIYGYTMCYKETGYEKHLKTAKELTAAYLKRLPEDYIRFWDLDDLKIQNTATEAAVIVVSGLWELSELEKNKTEKVYLKNAAEKMLRSLSSSSETENAAFLLHSTRNRSKKGEADIPIIITLRPK